MILVSELLFNISSNFIYSSTELSEELDILFYCLKLHASLMPSTQNHPDKGDNLLY